MNKSKQIILISSLLAIIIILPIFVYGEYKLLEPLPGGPETIKTGGFSAYLTALFNYAIAVAAVLAVIMIVIGGLQYIGAAGNTSVIEDAKDRIYWAIVGLILALGSWLILYNINPKLKELKLTVDPTVEPTNINILEFQKKNMFNAKNCEELGPYIKCEPNSLGCIPVGSLHCQYKPDNTGRTKLDNDCPDEDKERCALSNLKCAVFLGKDKKTLERNCE